MVMDEKNLARLRKIQADMLKTSERSVSLSYVLNKTIEVGLKHPRSIAPPKRK